MMFEFTIGHTVMKNKHHGMNAIKLTDKPYDGIIFSYGRVEIKESEDDDSATLSFEYEVHDWNDKTVDDETFKSYIGDLLQEIIMDGIKNNNISYTGGTDSE